MGGKGRAYWLSHWGPEQHKGERPTEKRRGGGSQAAQLVGTPDRYAKAIGSTPGQGTHKKQQMNT